MWAFAWILMLLILCSCSMTSTADHQEPPLIGKPDTGVSMPGLFMEYTEAMAEGGRPDWARRNAVQRGVRAQASARAPRSEDFAMRYRGRLELPSARDCALELVASGPARVWIDGALVLELSVAGTATASMAGSDEPASHAITIDFEHGRGAPELDLRRRVGDGAFASIPAEAYSHEVELAAFDTLWDYSDPAKTRERFQALVPAALACGDLNLRLEIETQIARTEGLERNFARSQERLSRVAAELTESTGPARVRYLLELGRSFNSSGDKKSACREFERAFDLATELGEEYHLIDAAHMLGIAEEPDAALEWNVRAIELCEATDDPRAQGWLGPLYNNTGWTYHDRADYSTALDYFEKSYEYRKARGQVGPTRIGKWCIARTYRSMGRVDEALQMQQALLAEFDGDPDHSPDGFVYEEIGECLRIQQKADAATYFAKAYELLKDDRWLKADEPQRLERMRRLAAGETVE